MNPMRTMESVRTWRGAALLSYGFRPFFLGGAIWGGLAMVLWLAMLAGNLSLPTRFDPVSWHAHEFLFGYLGAIVAGFLLTAIPNWTGRLPVAGWPLVGLLALWVSGRIAVAVSELWSPVLTAATDLAFPVVFALVAIREIVAGHNWRNLVVVFLLVVLTGGNAVFHWEAAQGDYAAEGYGLRIGLSTAIMLIALIGGRIVPSFTRNWLVKRGETVLPFPPMTRYDRICLVTLLATLVVWSVLPETWVTGGLLLVVGGLHFARLARWRGHRTAPEPLVWVLHAGYAFVPLGAVVLGASVLWPDIVDGKSAQHLWTAGAIGLMTVAVMTRATLGHTGRTLIAGPVTTAIYILLVLAVLARLLTGVFPEFASGFRTLSGLTWFLAFSGFSLFYGRLLITPRSKRQPA